MRKLLLIFGLIICTSCANSVDTSQNEPLEGSYQVVGINGKDIASEALVFNFSTIGNRVSGNTGCNQFSANFDQQGGKLEFSTPMNTRKFCEGRMELEKQLLLSLEQASKVEQNGNEFVITSEDGEALITLIKKDRSE